jgi:hypothetical protein
LEANHSWQVVAQDKHLAFIEDLGRVTSYWMVVRQTLEEVCNPLELFFLENHFAFLTACIAAAEKW